LLGIVSQVPGLTLGSEEGPGRPIKVALSGRTPVFVTGRVKPGDYITSSEVPGVGRVATHAGFVVGQAIAAKDDDGVSRVLVFIRNGWWDGRTIDSVDAAARYSMLSSGSTGTAALTALESLLIDRPSSASVEMLSADRFIAGLDIVAPSITTRHLTVNEIRTASNSLQVVLGADGQFDIRSSGSSTLLALNHRGDLVVAGDVTAHGVNIMDRLDQLGIQYLELNDLLVSELAAVNGRVASLSDQTALLSSLVGNMSTQLSDILEQTASHSEALMFSPSTIKGGLTVQGSTVLHGDTYFFGRPYFTADTGGFAVIPAGESEVDIVFDQDYVYPPVVHAMIALNAASSSSVFEQQLLDGNVRYIVTRRSIHGFTIRLAAAAPVDISLDWTALAIQEPKTFTVVRSAPAITPEPTPSSEQVVEPTPASLPSEQPTLEPTPEPTPEFTPEATPSPEPSGELVPEV
jgi:hypothetical protein